MAMIELNIRDSVEIGQNGHSEHNVAICPVGQEQKKVNNNQ